MLNAKHCHKFLLSQCVRSLVMWLLFLSLRGHFCFLRLEAGMTLWCPSTNRMEQKGLGGYNNKCLLLASPGVGSLRSGCILVRFWWEPSSCFVEGCLLLCAHRVRKEKGLWDTNPIPSSKPHHTPKAPLPHSIMLGLGLQHRNLRQTKTFNP